MQAYLMVARVLMMRTVRPRPSSTIVSQSRFVLHVISQLCGGLCACACVDVARICCSAELLCTPDSGVLLVSALSPLGGRGSDVTGLHSNYETTRIQGRAGSAAEL